MGHLEASLVVAKWKVYLFVQQLHIMCLPGSFVSGILGKNKYNSSSYLLKIL